MKTLVKHLIIW